MRHTSLGAKVALALVAFCASLSPSTAQTPSAGLQLGIDSLAQMRGEQAWRFLRERRVFSEAGKWIGRVEDVRVSPMEGSINASLRLRPRFGGGHAWVPIERFHQVEGRVVVSETLRSLRARRASRVP
jgi:sporulation protein YlmC with PRC-barrel domain